MISAAAKMMKCVVLLDTMEGKKWNALFTCQACSTDRRSLSFRWWSGLISPSLLPILENDKKKNVLFDVWENMGQETTINNGFMSPSQNQSGSIDLWLINQSIDQPINQNAHWSINQSIESIKPKAFRNVRYVCLSRWTFSCWYSPAGNLKS